MKRTIIISLFLVIPSILSAALPDITKKLVPAADKLFVGVTEQKELQLKKLQADAQEAMKTKAELEAKLQTAITDTNAQKEIVQKQLKDTPDNDFLQKKMGVLNESYQTLKDIERERGQVHDILNELIKTLTEYLSDADFTQFKRERKLTERSFYFFEDVQKIYDQISEYKKRITILADQEKTVQTELENRIRTSNATKESYRIKKKELESLGQKTADVNAGLTPAQVRELIDLEEQFFSYRTMLDGLRIQEMEYKKDLLELQSFLLQSRLNIYKEYLRLIKPRVRVIEADIVDAQENFAKKKAEYFSTREKYQKELDAILLQIKKKEQQRDVASKKFNITLGPDITQWEKEPRQTPESYLGITEVGVLNTEMIALEQQRDLIQAQMALEDQKYEFEELQVKVKQSYQRYSTGKFASEEDVAQERKKYESSLNESRRIFTAYKERITLNAELLDNAKKTLDNIAQMKTDIEKAHDTVFKGHQKDFQRSLELIKRAEDLVKEQVNTLTKLTGIYSGITSMATSIIRLSEFITSELESRTILYRPEHAIPWEGIKNIVPDILSFLNHVRLYIMSMSLSGMMEQLYQVATNVTLLGWFILKLLAIIGLLIFIWVNMPHVTNQLIRTSQTYGGMVRFLTLLIASMTSFVSKYFGYIGFWILAYAMLLAYPIYLSNVYILFYLISIPYLLFIANRFIHHMAYFNIRHGYPFLAPEFQRRFVLVISGLIYSSIIILFFRSAFIIANYPLSDLPTILLALNFIIFQISLYLLIDKEQILHLIPMRTGFWQWIHDQVNNYYFIIQLCVIAIIIMTNPYVGFSQLVIYILLGVVYTALILSILFWLQGTFKRIASEVFFSTRDDLVRERFQHAKTWFGLLIIFSFLFLSVIGIIITARIWGWHITFSEIKMVLSKPIMAGADPKNPITLISLFHIFLFVLGGYLVSYALNRFVLDKIFDLLLVDAGVQHTITSILQYLVLAVAIFLGFNYANLGSLVNYILGALILGLSWMLKEPIGDFVAYFIILVQRPIKIGDYIEVDAETMGVVRKITARSVVLRRKNSVTIIVPNTYLLSHTVKNWNYARNFIAFDDIIVNVDFKEDPDEVIEIFKTILDEHPTILKNPRPIIRLREFTDFGFQFMLRGFLSSAYTLDQWDIASAIRIVIVREFRKRNISFAFPARVVVAERPSSQSD